MGCTMLKNDFFVEKPSIDNVSEDIINDLYDIIDKFGSIDTEDNMMHFSSGDLGLGYEIHMSSSLDGSVMMVAKSASKITFQGIEFIRTIIGDIFWDGTLTAEEVKNATIKIYELGEGKIVDKFDFKPGKYSVDEIFSEIGTVFMVPDGKDPQKFIKRFDKPEKLIILENPVGIRVIHHRDHLSHVKKRGEIVVQLCKERGIDLSDINESMSKLDFDDIMKLREEIQRRMDI